MPADWAEQMIVAGLDSAETTGFALVERKPSGDEHLILYGAVPIRFGADVERLIAELSAACPDLVAVEEPFVHPRNPATGLSLARLLGRWLQVAETRGLTTVTVPASMWQPRILPGITHRSRSAERKAAARAFALDRFGVAVTEDEADAIAMATWVARTAARKGGVVPGAQGKVEGASR
jgi:Holliday junction resolvasome RuvABC endonuclease subunit